MRRLTPIASHVVDGARLMLFIFLAVAAIIFLAKAFITLSVPFSLDYGEGPLLDQAVRLAEGRPIYTSDVAAPPFTISNYPPLFMLIVSPFVKLFGPTLTAGRLISLLSTLATAVFLALIVRTFTEDRLATAATALIFLANPYVVQWTGLMRVDMLALALSTAALYVLVRWPINNWSLIVAGLLLVAAVFTRQSYGLAAPLAAFVWLWHQERRQALRLAAWVAGLGLLLFFILNIVTEGGFFFNTVTANVNTFSELDRWIRELVRTAPILLVMSGLIFLLAWQRDPSWPLLLPYLVGSILTALLIGKIGANVNYFLELSAAFSLVAGVLIHWSRQQPWLQAGLLVLLVLQVGLFMRRTLEGPVADLSFRRQDADAMADLAKVVAETDGPILADEHMALLPLQDRPLYLQPFEMTQLAHAGIWQQSGLLESIRNQEFPLILIYQYPGSLYPVHRERWTPQMLAAIEDYYRPTQILAGNILYRPLGETGTATMAAPAQNPTFVPDDLQVGQKLVVDQSSSMFFMPDVAANPNLPDHLAAGLMTIDDLDCRPPDCRQEVFFYTSTDGGVTWNEETPIFTDQKQLQQALVEFGPYDTLYALSLRGEQPFINRAQGEPYEMAVKASQISIIHNPIDPQLTTYPDSDRLIFAYSGRDRDNIGVRLNKSADQGQTWSPSIGVDDGVPLSELNSARANAPDNAQVLLGQGDDLAVVWRWDTGFWNWPLGVWLASSSDGGDSFGERQRIAETWGPISAGAHEGTYYILYRAGYGEKQQLAVAVSNDGGESWQASVASGEQVLSYGFDHVSGFDIAPDGTLDIAFYAPEGDAATCSLDRQEWINQFVEDLRDTCLYNLYYTFSRDGGQTFSEPIRLNEEPVHADSTQVFNTISVAVTSTDAYAYAIWNTILEEGGSQAVTVRIER